MSGSERPRRRFSYFTEENARANHHTGTKERLEMMRIALFLSLLSSVCAQVPSCSDPGRCFNPQECVSTPSVINFLFLGGGTTVRRSSGEPSLMLPHSLLSHHCCWADCSDTSGLSGSNSCTSVGSIPKLATPDCTDELYTVTFNVNGGQGTPEFAGSLKVGDTFQATGILSTANLVISINGNGKQHSYSFDPSCSAPLSLGAIVGSLEITGIIYPQGGSIDCDLQPVREDF